VLVVYYLIVTFDPRQDLPGDGTLVAPETLQVQTAVCVQHERLMPRVTN
jgi:hypothetical protein